MVTIRKHTEYTKWLSKITSKKLLAQIEERLARIVNSNHYGTVKCGLKVDGKAIPQLCELKFNDGTRIYWTRTGKEEITLLYGGNKNGQAKDIRKAASLLT